MRVHPMMMHGAWCIEHKAQRCMENFETFGIVIGVGQVDLRHELLAESAVGRVAGEVRMILAREFVMQMFEALGIMGGTRGGGAGERG